MGQYGRNSIGPYQIARLFDWSAGLNTTNSPTDIQDNECTILENFLISEKGVLKKRNGLRAMNDEELLADPLPYDYDNPNIG